GLEHCSLRALRGVTGVKLIQKPGLSKGFEKIPLFGDFSKTLLWRDFPEGKRSGHLPRPNSQSLSKRENHCYEKDPFFASAGPAVEHGRRSTGHPPGAPAQARGAA